MQNNFKYFKKIPKNPTNDSKVIIMLHWVWSNSDNLFHLSSHFENDYVFSLNWLFDLWNNAYAWYHLSYFNNKPIYNGSEVDIGYNYIVEFIEYIKKEYDLVSKEIFLLWFSQWSNMSYYLFGKSPELVSWIIALSGRFLKETSELTIKKESYNNKKVFIWHGTSDSVIDVSVVQELKKYIENTWVEPIINIYENMPHTIIEEEMKDVVRFLNS